MELKIKNITIKCDLLTAWMTGNAYHEVKIYQNNILMAKKTIHGCENGAEAMLSLVADLPDSDYKQDLADAICDAYC